MIKVTRFDGSAFYVSPHQIEFIESTPDTVISLVSGRKIVVSEPIDKILKEIIEYRQKVTASFGGNET